MECFHIDESGYTGFNLLNPEQRVQGATAVAITGDEVPRLKEHPFRTMIPESGLAPMNNLIESTAALLYGPLRAKRRG
ncbi:hypothetical protein D7M10_18125 [Pseudomonas fluorescens]|uniref:hypothetical protein n=1 Tax=Pseudomonas sp. BIGb0381 TaxID=2940608 RepID=UPI000EAA0A3A|nr:hypothetical protein [Pseudomonas sp. BIGb0381]AYG08881.1 hypothetical protein D7M10_18125 [Pseudomonas fluorescens]MCS4313138.1 hypothetical protein [Pseudomonas sp. BIGb0381]